MTETTDVAWTIVVRIEDTDRWIDWSTGHRTVPDVLAAAELIVPVSTIAEIRFDRITTARKRFSLADIGATDAAVPSVPADADLRERAAAALYEAEYPGYEWPPGHFEDREQFRQRADAVLPVLPAPADRAAVLREAANGLAALGPLDSLVSAPAAWTEAIETLRRMADQIAEDEARRKADEAQQADPTRRVLTPNEHDRVWYAIEGAAGEPGADPGTVLNAVLAALGIDAPTAEEEQAASPRRMADEAQQARKAQR